MNSVEVFFPGVSEELSELLIAELSALNFDPFWQDEDGLRAYIEKEKLNDEDLQLLAVKYGDGVHLPFSVQSTVPDEWDRVKTNEVKPFVIADRITILDPASNLKAQTPFEIFMSAQMAFGDGNHPSTELCLTMMLDMDFQNKRVIDAGTGSGILAVMAEKLGAQSVLAFDNNPWAIEVSAKTIQQNKCTRITLESCQIQDCLQLSPFDVVLANLNFMVFQTEFKNVVKFISLSGKLLVSGVMKKDEPELLKMASEAGLILDKKLYLGSWVAVLFMI